MTFENWAAFAVASGLLIVIPGPTILLVISYALGQGRRTALPVAAGVALGDFTSMTLSMAGVGALLMASTTILTALKWLGACYLIYLGAKLFLASDVLEVKPRTEGGFATEMMGHAWLVTALNPKGITFFVAFLPQFFSPNANYVGQMVTFEATFLSLAFTNALAYGLFASRVRDFASNPRAIYIFNKIGGSLLIGTAIASVAVRYGN